MSSMSGSSGFGARGGGPGDVVPKGYRKGQLQQFSPEQMQLFQQLFGQVGPNSYLSKLAGGDEELFNEMEAPAHRQFSELLGGLGSRFSGMGSLGARNSSGFQNTASAAASNFAQDLQSNRQNLQRQAIQDLMGLSNQLLGQRPTQNVITPKRQSQNSSGWGGLAGAGIGGVGGFLAGGPVGALTGAKLGYGVGSGFDQGAY